MRALSAATALMLLLAGTALAQSPSSSQSPSSQSPSRDPSRPSQGLGYGGGAGGTSGYGYSTGNNPSGHYGGGYIGSDGRFNAPQGQPGTGESRFDGYGSRASDPRKPRY